MSEVLVPTPVGTARVTWYPARGKVRAVALLGHGSATGIESADLQALAAALPPRDVTVGLVTQPYRLDGNPRASDEKSLDLAWMAVWSAVATGLNVPVIAGGRSAGSQVACRTARDLGAHMVLALAYPLLGPGSSSELLATGRPALLVQGGRDPFGRPEQFPRLPAEIELVEIPSAGHVFGSADLTLITTSVTGWIERKLEIDTCARS